MDSYISEISYPGNVAEDFVEIAVPAGTDVSAYTIVIYTNSGAVRATVSLGSLESTTAGKDVYLVDDSDPGFQSFGGGMAVALVDDLGNVVQFVSFSGNTVTASAGPAIGQTSTNIGTASGTNTSLETTDGGSSYQVATSNPGTIPCYAPGTMIDTPDGPQAVETLQVSDLVMTADHGPQPIRWVRSGEMPLEQVEPDAKPVLIKAGALGQNLPMQDMIVSPQHRILGLGSTCRF